MKNKQRRSKELLNTFPMNGHTLESKVRKLCITQGFILGVKGLNIHKRRWVPVLLTFCSTRMLGKPRLNSKTLSREYY